MATGRFSLARLNELKVYDEQGGWTLDLSGNNLTRLPPALTSLEAAIRSLDISENPELKRLPTDFGRLSKLRRLDAVQCGFGKFPSGLCDVRSLRSLRLSLNNMTQYPAALPALRGLEVLELVMCALTEVPGCVTSLVRLRRLDLRCNRLSAASFPPSFADLKLSELDISSNELVIVPDCVTRVPTLRILKMCHCSLGAIPSSVGRLKNLVDLRASHNNLEAIPAEVCSLRQLEQLHLDHNRLTRLPRCLAKLKKLIGANDGFVIAPNNTIEPPQEKLCERIKRPSWNTSK